MSSFSHVQEVIEDVYEKYKGIEEGEVANYIPELARPIRSILALLW